MNLVKLLRKQKENGKEIIMPDGNIISKNDIEKSNMKSYLAGIKDGSISPTTSLQQYSEENGNDFATIDEVIKFIEEGPAEDAAE